MKSNILLILALVVSSSMFASSTSHAANKIKSHHKDAGLSCKDCHTTKPFDEVEMDQCLTCHELPEKKDDYHGAPDKHDSPHYGPELGCINCHFEHDTSENFCNSCHDFDFVVP